MHIVRHSIFIGLLSMAGTAAADVLQAFGERHGMSGLFIQHVFSPDGELLESTEGKFSLLRPHFLRWQIESPDKQLLIAADDTLTQIDWDLEVISARAMTPGNRSALDWLMAPRDELERTFEITAASGRTTLIPRESMSTFERLELGFEPESSRWELALTDTGGQILRVLLTEDPNVIPIPSDFIAPPTGFE